MARVLGTIKFLKNVPSAPSHQFFKWLEVYNKKNGKLSNNWQGRWLPLLSGLIITAAGGINFLNRRRSSRNRPPLSSSNRNKRVKCKKKNFQSLVCLMDVWHRSRSESRYSNNIQNESSWRAIKSNASSTICTLVITNKKQKKNWVMLRCRINGAQKELRNDAEKKIKNKITYRYCRCARLVQHIKRHLKKKRKNNH